MLSIPGLPLPDFQPPPQERTHYVLFEDGTLGQITTTSDQDPVLTRGGRLVTQDVYEELRAQMLQAHQDRLDRLQAEEEAARLAQYEELKAVGLSEATARGLSGYSGPQTGTGSSS